MVSYNLQIDVKGSHWLSYMGIIVMVTNYLDYHRYTVLLAIFLHIDLKCGQ